MTDQDRSDWLPTDEAAARLGVSVATIKRRIADGKPVRLPSGDSVELEAEMLERPQGHEWRVRIVGALAALNSDQERSDQDESAPLSAAQERSGALVAALKTVTGLVADLRALERENGSLVAQRDAEKARADALAADLERERRRGWWARLRGR